MNSKRNEDRDQRQRERDDGEADFAGAFEGGLHGRIAVLQMADDVLDHDDGVVDDEAGADGEGHQRQVVEAEAHEPHDAERGDERNGQGDAGDDGGAEGAQEQKHDEHDEADAQDECELHVVHRSLDGAGAVAHHIELDAGLNGALDARQLILDAVDGLDDVGAGLALHVDDDGGLALVPAADARVLEAVGNGRHVLEAHGRVVAIGDDDVLVGLRAVDLVVGGNGERLLVAIERALGSGDVGACDGLAEVGHAEAVAREPRDVGLNSSPRV